MGNTSDPTRKKAALFIGSTRNENTRSQIKRAADILLSHKWDVFAENDIAIFLGKKSININAYLERQHGRFGRHVLSGPNPLVLALISDEHNEEDKKLLQNESIGFIDALFCFDTEEADRKNVQELSHPERMLSYLQMADYDYLTSIAELGDRQIAYSEHVAFADHLVRKPIVATAIIPGNFEEVHGN